MQRSQRDKSGHNDLRSPSGRQWRQDTKYSQSDPSPLEAGAGSGNHSPLHHSTSHLLWYQNGRSERGPNLMAHPEALHTSNILAPSAQRGAHEVHMPHYLNSSLLGGATRWAQEQQVLNFGWPGLQRLGPGLHNRGRAWQRRGDAADSRDSALSWEYMRDATRTLNWASELSSWASEMQGIGRRNASPLPPFSHGPGAQHDAYEGANDADAATSGLSQNGHVLWPHAAQGFRGVEPPSTGSLLESLCGLAASQRGAAAPVQSGTGPGPPTGGLAPRRISAERPGDTVTQSLSNTPDIMAAMYSLAPELLQDADEARAKAEAASGRKKADSSERGWSWPQGQEYKRKRTRRASSVSMSPRVDLALLSTDGSRAAPSHSALADLLQGPHDSFAGQDPAVEMSSNPLSQIVTDLCLNPPSDTLPLGGGGDNEEGLSLAITPSDKSVSFLLQSAKPPFVLHQAIDALANQGAGPSSINDLSAARLEAPQRAAPPRPPHCDVAPAPAFLKREEHARADAEDVKPSIETSAHRAPPSSPPRFSAAAAPPADDAAGSADTSLVQEDAPAVHSCTAVHQAVPSPVTKKRAAVEPAAEDTRAVGDDGEEATLAVEHLPVQANDADDRPGTPSASAKPYRTRSRGKPAHSPPGSQRRRCSSVYKGVTKHKRSGRWEANLWVNELGRQVYLGGYTDELDAARAYDIVLLKCKGITANTNFSADEYSGILEAFKDMSVLELAMDIRRRSGGFSHGKSNYRGVTTHPSGRWEARIGIPGSKHIYLGLHSNEVDAAIAYDEAVTRLRGLAALTNFPLQNCAQQVKLHETVVMMCAAGRQGITDTIDELPKAYSRNRDLVASIHPMSKEEAAYNDMQFYTFIQKGILPRFSWTTGKP